MSEIELLNQQLEVLRDQLSFLRVYTMATVILTIAAISAGILAWFQIRGLKGEREWSIASAMLDELRSSERIELQRELWESDLQPADFIGNSEGTKYTILVTSG